MNIKARLKNIERKIGSERYSYEPVKFFIKEHGKYFLMKNGQKIETEKPKPSGQPGVSAFIFEVPEIY